MKEYGDEIDQYFFEANSHASGFQTERPRTNQYQTVNSNRHSYFSVKEAG